MILPLSAWLILSALASFRLSEMFVIDNGPFDVFMYFRGWSISNNPFRKLIGGIFNCVHCAGFYTSLFFVGLYYWQSELSIALLAVFAVAGVQSILARLIGRNN